MRRFALGARSLPAYPFCVSDWRVESSGVGKSSFCWLRTNSGSIVSESTMSRFLRRDIFMQFHKQAHLAILQIIRSKMESGNDADLPGAA